MRQPDGDDGFSLVETVVAMMVFAVLAAVTGTFLLNTLGVSKSSSQRVAAANLAAKYVEEVRGMRALDIVDGGASFSETVGATTYAVRRTASYVASGQATSLCAGLGNNVVYKLVTITVTWPSMGSVKPVRTDTLKALGLGDDGLSSSRGIAAVQVLSGTGAPVPDVTVTLSSATPRTTGIDGCALFPQLTPGTTYSASVQLAGYTGLRGVASPVVTPITVTAGQVTRTSVSYDSAGTLATSFSFPAGYDPPVTVGVSAWSSPGTETFPVCSSTVPTHCVTAGSPHTAGSIYPASYTVWGGVCAAKPPAASTATVPPGQPAAVTVPLAPLAVDLRDKTTLAPLPGRTLYLIATGAICADRHTAVSNAAGTVQTSLPSGSWQLALTQDGSGAPMGGWPTVTLDAYGATAPRKTVYG